MLFGTVNGKQIAYESFMRGWRLGDVLKMIGYLKMGGRNSEFASRLMTTFWYCVATAVSEARREGGWKRGSQQRAS